MILERIQKEALPNHHALYLSFEPDNTWGRELYQSRGFSDDNRTVDGECVFRLDF